MERNICKFIPKVIEKGLTVSCFIYETDAENIKCPIQLNSHRIYIIIKGEGDFCFTRETVSVAKGDIVFGFEGENIEHRCSDDCEYMYINFSGMRANELFSRFDIRERNRLFSGFDGLIPLWKESLSRASEDTIDLASESMLLYAFSRFSGTVSEKTGIVRAITEISESDFNDPELSVTSIAKRLGYNSKYISHIFKEKMGLSYSEYLRTLRIKYAVSLFDHGIDSVKNVALLSGFSDPLYFSTIFKSTIGVSPKEYLSRNQNIDLK